MRYRKKSIVIDAWQWDGSEEKATQLIQDHGIKGSVQKVLEGETPTVAFRIFTLEGGMSVSKGDYIIKGVEGEFYPCKPAIFKKTYEEVGISIEEIDAALAEHNLHESWIEAEDSLEALKRLLDKEMKDEREEE